MKTDAERMALIRQRTAQLQRQARARQMLLIDAGCMARPVWRWWSAWALPCPAGQAHRSRCMFPPPAPPGC